jgi:hypothetical protein
MGVMDTRAEKETNRIRRCKFMGRYGWMLTSKNEVARDAAAAEKATTIFNDLIFGLPPFVMSACVNMEHI